jgi:hypothetical protein
MRYRPCALSRVVLSCLLLPGGSRALPQRADATGTEGVKLSYQLILTKCRGSSCHSETAAKGEVDLSLELEDPSFLYDYKATEAHAGDMAYQFRFEAWHALKGQAYARALQIGFSGRIGTLSGRQVAWAEKSFKAKEWKALPSMSVSGDSYSEGGETITPTLQVSVSKVVR